MNSRMTSLPVSRLLHCLLFAAFILFAGTGVAAARNLFSDPLFPTSAPPYSMTAADFNGDGTTDLAMVSGTGDLMILLGRGDGDFEPAQETSIGDESNYLVAADFNGDGRMDLAVAFEDGFFSIFLGGGDGTFTLHDQYPVGDTPYFHPRFLAVADLNLDGVPDLMVGSTAPKVSVFLGKGDGTLQPEALFDAGGGATVLTAVDFNLDGFPDLAVATADNQEAAILFGHGNGEFDPPVSLGGEPGGTFVCSGDFDRDGKPDLAVLGPIGVRMSILLGDGTGGIRDRTVTSFPRSLEWLIPADFNGDGALDLATGTGLLQGNGDGTFGPMVPNGTQSNTGAVADFDGNGFPDLAGADPGLRYPFVLFNDGHGHLGGRLYRNSSIGIVKGDFNGDGRTDLAGFNTSIYILLGQSDGTFIPAADVPAAQSIQSLAAGDFDGDGRLDLAASLMARNPQGILTGFVWMFRGLGDGTFQGPVATPTLVLATGLVTGDFNGDGRADLVAVRNHDPYLQTLLGRADGTFQVIEQVGLAAAASAAAVADFDADGRLDLAVAHPGQLESVSLLSGNGDGTFMLRASYPVGGFLYSLAIADLNGDGQLDVAAGHFASGPIICPPGCPVSSVSVLLGQGNWLLGAETRYEARGAVSLDAADFDHDGHLDLIASGATILFGAGDGTFGRAKFFTHFGSGVVDDFNQDGWPDVAVAPGIFVTLNQGSRDTTPPQLTVTFTPNSLWPPNNQLVDITAHVQATDDSGGIVEVKLASIEGIGKAASPDNVAGAEIGTADFSFQLRAVRRLPRQEAYYRITYTATDAAGNQSTVTGIVQLPHDVRRASGRGHGIPPSP